MEEYLKKKDIPRFLLDSLDPIVEVDTDSLSEYIIALLSNRFTNRSELESTCVKDLEDFLKSHTKSFTKKLIDKLQDINYFTIELGSSNGDSKTRSPSPRRSYSPQRSSSYRDDRRERDRDDSRRERDRDDGSGSSSRRERERDRDDGGSSGSGSRRERDRDGYRERDRDDGGNRRERDRDGYTSRRERDRDERDDLPSSSRDTSNNYSSRDYNNDDDDRRKYSDDYEKKRVGTTRYNPMAGAPSTRGRGGMYGRGGGGVKRCRNYPNCERPNCPYLHTDAPDNNNNTGAPPFMDGGMNGDMMMGGSGYDPNSYRPPGYLAKDRPVIFGHPGIAQPLMYPFHHGMPPVQFPPHMQPDGSDMNNNNNNNYNNNQDDMVMDNSHDDDQPQQQQQGMKKFVKVKISPHCPDPSATVLIITNIPAAQNTEEDIKLHFSKFGNIEQIEKISSSQSTVKFENNVDAVKAMKSPEAIMNNRFIKLFWNDSYDGKKTKFEETQEKAAKKLEEEKKREQRMLQIKEQLLQQKLAEKKKVAMEKKKSLDIVKSREELRQQQLDLQKQLLDKLASCTDDEERQQIKETIKSIEKSITESINDDTNIVKKINQQQQQQQQQSTQPPLSGGDIEMNEQTINVNNDEINNNNTINNNIDNNSTNTSNLESIYKNLMSEAKSLGLEIPSTINTPATAVATTTTAASTAVVPKKPLRPVPKKVPGYPYPAAAYKPHRNVSMVVDNRTTTIMIADPPAEFKKEEVLKQIFSGIQSVTPTADAIEIKFNKREAAELVFKVAKTYKGKELQITWVEPLKTSSSSNMDVDTTNNGGFDGNSNNNTEEWYGDSDDDENEDNERSWKH